MSISPETIAGFRRQAEREWLDNIAPFWSRYAPDKEYGGFRGWITNDLQIDEQAEKGIVLNSRILWTFAHAYKLYQDANFRQLAERAYGYLTGNFIDQDYGGVFWTLDYRGQPSDTKKRTYAQAFALYGLTEFYLATNERAALDQAVAIFDLLESRCRDLNNEGYFETFERDWTLASEQRLSDVDEDEKKSMNTHLHMLEAYATLARASASERVRTRLRAVIEIFLMHIIDRHQTSQRMFFDERWISTSERVSFGHDIEASWLLCEAAEVLTDGELSTRVEKAALNLAQSVHDRGLDTDGALLYEADTTGIIDDDKHWWTQTEAVIGFVNAYQLSGDESFLMAALRVWEFINQKIVDKENGEWFWKVTRAGVPASDMPKLSQWKCPYHNGRMCFEIKRRLSDMLEGGLDK
jgi:mannobiose 2-epimerase